MNCCHVEEKREKINEFKKKVSESGSCQASIWDEEKGGALTVAIKG